MKVTARISLGYGVLLASILLLAVLQVSAVRQLQGLNEDLSASGFNTALASLELMKDTELIAENAGRFFLHGDPEARNQIEPLRAAFQSSLQQLRAGNRSDGEGRETERLSQFWQQFVDDFSREQAAPQPGKLPPVLAEDLDRLRTQARTVYQASLDSIEARVSESRSIARRTEYLSWVYASGVIIVGGLMSLLILRSVAAPLSALAEGTRAIAEGGTHYRLDASRNDEIAQIAKDFNTLAERLK